MRLTLRRRSSTAMATFDSRCLQRAEQAVSPLLLPRPSITKAGSVKTHQARIAGGFRERNGGEKV